MARERRGFIVTQVWAEIAYTDQTGQQRKFTKPATAQASDNTKHKLTDADKQKRKQAVGNFPFDTRATPSDEDFHGAVLTRARVDHPNTLIINKLIPIPPTGC